MSTVEKSIRLYAWKTNYQTFQIVQGEADSRTFNIQLFSTTMPVDLTNCSVKLFAVKPDSTKVYVDCTVVNAEDGIVSVTLNEQIGVIAGTVDCWIQVIGEGGTDLRFEGMNIEVSECIIEQSLESNDDMKAFLQESAKLAAVETELKNARMGSGSLQAKQKAQDSALQIQKTRIDNLIATGTAQNQELGKVILTTPRGVKYQDYNSMETSAYNSLFNGVSITDTNFAQPTSNLGKANFKKPGLYNLSFYGQISRAGSLPGGSLLISLMQYASLEDAEGTVLASRYFSFEASTSITHMFNVDFTFPVSESTYIGISVQNLQDKDEKGNIKFGAGACQLTVLDWKGKQSADLAELHDVRIGTDGTEYETAGQAVREQLNKRTDEINNVRETLSDLVIISQSKNLLNPDNIIHGHFYKVVNKNGTSYIELAENARFDCALVEVIDGVTDYIANGISYNSYSVTKDMEYLGIVSKAAQSVNNPVFDTTVKSGGTPNKPVKYLTMSWSNKLFDTSHMIIVAGKTLPDEYISYFKQKKLNDEIIIDYSQIKNTPELDKEIKLYVGFGDVNNKTKFDKIIDAFKETEKQEGKYIVYIAEGTYDMFNEYGGIETLQNYDSSKDTPYNTQPWLYNTTVIGNGRVKLVYAPDTTEYSEARWLYSPLNIRGNTKIENIEIYCDGGRYCIHDETGSISTYYDTEHIYKNVVCETGANTGRCIGGGCDYGQRYTLENCTFKTGYTKAWSNAGIVSWHNRKTTRGCTFLFNNCKFLCTETSKEHSDLRFSNVGSGNALSNVSLNNCYFSFGQIRLAIESESNPSDNRYQIICSNSNKQNLLVDEKLGKNLYPLIEYNPI